MAGTLHQICVTTGLPLYNAIHYKADSVIALIGHGPQNSHSHYKVPHYKADSVIALISHGPQNPRYKEAALYYIMQLVHLK